MKKSIKRVITIILAIATVAATAALFAGCGEKSDEEKIMDAFNDLANDAKNDLNDGAKNKQSSVEKEEVTLNFYKTIKETKPYTIKASQLSHKFYLEFDQTMEVDGFTLTKTDEKIPESEYSDYSCRWEIAKDGKKVGTIDFPLNDVGYGINNNYQMTFKSLNGYIADESDSEYKLSVDMDESEITVDVPKAYTEQEAKQNLAQFKDMSNQLYPITNGHMSVTGNGRTFDVSNAALKNIYYVPGEEDGEYFKSPKVVCVYAGVVDGDVIYKDGFYVAVEFEYPYSENGTTQTLAEPVTQHGSNLKAVTHYQDIENKWIKLS